MSPDNQATQQSAPSIHEYVQHQRKAGKTDLDIGMQLMQAGWTQDQINQVLLAGVPAPQAPVAYNQLAQTSNAGTPLQVENVQYNMRMKPVESKVGLYIKIAGAGLWFTVLFLCGFLTTLIHKIAGDGGDLGAALVFTLSLAVVTTPIFILAYRKFRTEQLKNPITSDDIFFKRSVRRSLTWGIIFGAIAAIITLFQFMSALFLKNSGGSYSSALSALVFALGFGGIVYFYWRLHAKTQR